MGLFRTMANLNRQRWQLLSLAFSPPEQIRDSRDSCSCTRCSSSARWCTAELGRDCPGQRRCLCMERGISGEVDLFICQVSSLVSQVARFDQAPVHSHSYPTRHAHTQQLITTRSHTAHAHTAHDHTARAQQLMANGTPALQNPRRINALDPTVACGGTSLVLACDWRARMIIQSV